MPDERLKRTRRAYELRCGHKSQIADEYRVVTRADGTTERERVPQRFMVSSQNARYCLGCGQFVDDADPPVMPLRDLIGDAIL